MFSSLRSALVQISPRSISRTMTMSISLSSNTPTTAAGAAVLCTRQQSIHCRTNMGIQTTKRFSSNVAKALDGLKGRHFLSIDELSNDELYGLLELSHDYKKTYGKEASVNATSAAKPLTGESVAMIFQKRSTRTRVSTETGMFLLGGHALFLGPQDIQLGVNETMQDTALVLSRFNSILLARVYAHSDITELAQYAKVPVINALSDRHHPLQTLADLMALQQHFASTTNPSNGNDNIDRNILRGKTLAWVGDGNNVLHDLMFGATKMGMNLRIATPAGYEPDPHVLNITNDLVVENNTLPIVSTTDASVAVKGADVIVTDTWVSMGQEEEYEKRLKEFDGYQVNSDLMGKANSGAVFLHCLPRHKEEVTDEVFYSDASLVFPEAENRMWTVMAVMAAQLGKV